jgi:hypothetical protein
VCAHENDLVERRTLVEQCPRVSKRGWDLVPKWKDNDREERKVCEKRCYVVVR